MNYYAAVLQIGRAEFVLEAVPILPCKSLLGHLQYCGPSPRCHTCSYKHLFGDFWLFLDIKLKVNFNNLK